MKGQNFTTFKPKGIPLKNWSDLSTVSQDRADSMYVRVN